METEKIKEKLGKSVPESVEELKAVHGKLQSLFEDFKKEIEEKKVEPKVEGGKVKYADDTLVQEKFEKMEKAMGDLEDKLKTSLVRNKGKEMYETSDGLLKTFLPKNATTEVELLCRNLAKSIVEDPIREEYSNGFKKAIRKRDKDSVAKAMGELVEKVKATDIDVADSFIKKSLTTVRGEDGGYFCPPDVSLMIHKNLYETSPVRQVATVQTISAGELKFYIQREEPVARWQDEELRDSEESEAQKYEEGKISVHQLSAEPRISLNALEDSLYDLEGELLMGLTARFMRAENRAFIGSSTKVGDDRPTGLLWYAGKGAVNLDNYKKPLAVKWGVNITRDLAADDILNLEASLLSQYKGKAIWIVNRPSKNIIRQLKTTTNEYLFSMQNFGGFQGLPQIRDGRHGNLLGYPILECDDLPTLNESGARFPIMFGDFSNYCILDRIGMMMIIDDVTKKGYRKYYVRKRVGGGLKLGQGLSALRQAKA